jgi:hypothetical protein
VLFKILRYAPWGYATAFLSGWVFIAKLSLLFGTTVFLKFPAKIVEAVVCFGRLRMVRGKIYKTSLAFLSIQLFRVHIQK